ncbi:MAG: hypothetical protein CVV12_14210 [Gammaproteobacteria bacterium HGW-Gammaproteobacteria-2]|nr:MAG: hypothetical protein CVV12_14210 [Gammaproteobacteria bacterium HGW-Gammaproteobacteria-2]
MHDAPAFVHDALARGAAGFLSKRAAAEALPDALAAVARGERYTGDNKQPALREDPLATLTPREHAVLLQTVMGRRPAEIGEALGVHVKTVYAHRLSLMAKLSARNPMDLYRIARQHGLIS